MTKLLLHFQTNSHIQKFINNPTHALLLVGPEGAGKKYLADYLAATLLQIPVKKLDTTPRVLRISNAGGAISIELIRQLTGFLRLKTTGNSDIRRIVIIHDLQNMTIEAQNALLKSLEEPPADTVFLLTAASIMDIKATILSRSQKIIIKSHTLTEAKKYFAEKGTDSGSVEKAYALSEGNIGLLTALLQKKDHPLISGISAAKKYLSSSQFERLKSPQFSQDKEEINLFLSSLSRVCLAASRMAADKNSPSIQDWHRRLQVVYEAQESLTAHANPKLVLTHLSLAL